jgi:hypothetical protein
VWPKMFGKNDPNCPKNRFSWALKIFGKVPT